MGRNLPPGQAFYASSHPVPYPTVPYAEGFYVALEGGDRTRTP